MNESRFQPHGMHGAIDGGEMLPFRPLVDAWDMLSAAAILRLRWTAARFGADGLVPLALQGNLEPSTCGWLAQR